MTKINIIIIVVLVAFIGVFYTMKTTSSKFAPVFGDKIDSLNGVIVYYNGSVGTVKGRNRGKDGYNIGLKYPSLCTMLQNNSTPNNRPIFINDAGSSSFILLNESTTTDIIVISTKKPETITINIQKDAAHGLLYGIAANALG